MKKLSRAEKRNQLAENVCREVRYQLATYGKIINNDQLYYDISKWLKVAKKNKYKRP